MNLKQMFAAALLGRSGLRSRTGTDDGNVPLA